MAYLVALVVVIIGGAVFYLFQSDAPVVSTPEPTPAVEVVEMTQGEAPLEMTSQEASVEKTPSEAPSTPSPQAESDYKDGTFTSDVTYLTPKRDTYGVNVSLTLQEDIITSATVTYSNGAEKDPNAARFEAAYKAQVIGKDIDTVNLSRVGGASLTTNAFNNALAEIKVEARS